MQGQIRWLRTRRPCCELKIGRLYRSSPGNPNICKAQAHKQAYNLIGEPSPSQASPSQAETNTGRIVQEHRPSGQLFRLVLGAGDGPFQGSYPDEGCHYG